MALDPTLSPSVQRALSRPRPRWRGRLHRWAFVAWWPLTVALVAAADTGRQRLGAAVFGGGMLAMFGVSALVHAKAWSPSAYHRLIQLDHTAIFVCVATGATPIALLAMAGRPAAVLLWGVWTGAVVGVVAEWLPFHPPRFLMNTVYLSLGWFPVVLVPWMWDGLGGLGLVLLGAGGLCYTVGAAIVGAQRPDPAPLVFGYHELWHALVVAAAGFHTAMVFTLL